MLLVDARRFTMVMTKEHKAALAQGRLEARSVKAYLASLGPKKRGRPVTKDSLRKKISEIDSKLKTETNPLKRLGLLQSKTEAEHALAKVGSENDEEQLAADFVEYAKAYSDRKGISYATWRQFGVPADILRKAGIPQTRSRTY
jgi:hypothetical protein